MHHGAVNQRSLEQQFRKSDVVTFIVRPLVIVELALTAGRQSGRPIGRQMCCKVRKFTFCIFDF